MCIGIAKELTMIVPSSSSEVERDIAGVTAIDYTCYGRRDYVPQQNGARRLPDAQPSSNRRIAFRVRGCKSAAMAQPSPPHRVLLGANGSAATLHDCARSRPGQSALDLSSLVGGILQGLRRHLNM
jgi:hypothetical protein